MKGVLDQGEHSQDQPFWGSWYPLHKGGPASLGSSSLIQSTSPYPGWYRRLPGIRLQQHNALLTRHISKSLPHFDKDGLCPRPPAALPRWLSLAGSLPPMVALHLRGISKRAALIVITILQNPSKRSEGDGMLTAMYSTQPLGRPPLC
jgi:hypothetical protein